MKLSHSLMIQTAALLLTVSAGAVLNGDLIDGPREVHRFMGFLAGVLGAVTVVQALAVRAPLIVVMLLFTALAFTFFAAVAGSSLETTSDYQQAFNNMRLSGVIALASSIAALVLQLHPVTRKR